MKDEFKFLSLLCIGMIMVITSFAIGMRILMAIVSPSSNW